MLQLNMPSEADGTPQYGSGRTVAPSREMRRGNAVSSGAMAANGRPVLRQSTATRLGDYLGCAELRSASIFVRSGAHPSVCAQGRSGQHRMETRAGPDPIGDSTDGAKPGDCARLLGAGPGNPGHARLSAARRPRVQYALSVEGLWSRTKTSSASFLSSGTRFVAIEWNTMKRPSTLIAVPSLSPLA